MTQSDISPKAVLEYTRLLGLDFTPTECEWVAMGMNMSKKPFQQLRANPLENRDPPAYGFSLLEPSPAGLASDTNWWTPTRTTIDRPAKEDDLAFLSVAELAGLIADKTVSATELTNLYLARLKKYDDSLHCVVNLLEQRALASAQRADEEIQAGRYRGPLHGIPYGIKDLFAAKSAPTTWGAAPYKDRVFQEDAGIVSKLEEQGAVLIAKLSTGTLAYHDDVWFGGQTKNPWDPKQGALGSSAGPAAAVAAGLVPFSVGTETKASISAPCDRCGVFGLRPTPGLVSRTGLMTQSWTMDRIGPIGRTVEDCALVFNAIQGPDGTDPEVTRHDFQWEDRPDLRHLTIGYVADLFDRNPQMAPSKDQLKVFTELGARLKPVKIPDYPSECLRLIVFAEAAASFDELTTAKKDALLTHQGPTDIPNFLRTARLIPAVAYIQANRIRARLMAQMKEIFREVDLYLLPNLPSEERQASCYCGLPALVIPNRFDERGRPESSFQFVGPPHGESLILSVGHRFTRSIGITLGQPPMTRERNPEEEKALN
ncbi:Amidase [Sulfidibacter corallicola]|uniref:Amidase n=1 Tax=Sulfidibacter corallicola TaxID=2818388 RepID=A0A8A4TT67_SULCO|nr:amidase [Sulfidibacter corallicola]QTD52251.1 amidase [Sulfidibacter corallicola]